MDSLLVIIAGGKIYGLFLFNIKWLIDAFISGSDTTSSVMSNIFYLLLTHPLVFARLQEEVDANFSSGEQVADQTKLAGMPYLNACMLVESVFTTLSHLLSSQLETRRCAYFPQCPLFWSAHQPQEVEDRG